MKQKSLFRLMWRLYLEFKAPRFVKVKSYFRLQNGKVVKVRSHYRCVEGR